MYKGLLGSRLLSRRKCEYTEKPCGYISLCDQVLVRWYIVEFVEDYMSQRDSWLSRKTGLILSLVSGVIVLPTYVEGTIQPW